VNFCIARPQPIDATGKAVADSTAPLLQRDAGRVDAVFDPRGPAGWIGLDLTWTEEGMAICGIAPRSPAAGRLALNDVIVRIDGQATARAAGNVSGPSLLGGPVGAPVWLRVRRVGEAIPRLVTVVRGARPT